MGKKNLKRPSCSQLTEAKVLKKEVREFLRAKDATMAFARTSHHYLTLLKILDTGEKVESYNKALYNCAEVGKKVKVEITTVTLSSGKTFTYA